MLNIIPGHCYLVKEDFYVTNLFEITPKFRSNEQCYFENDIIFFVSVMICSERLMECLILSSRYHFSKIIISGENLEHFFDFIFMMKIKKPSIFFREI